MPERQRVGARARAPGSADRELRPAPGARQSSIGEHVLQLCVRIAPVGSDALVTPDGSGERDSPWGRPHSHPDIAATSRRGPRRGFASFVVRLETRTRTKHVRRALMRLEHRLDAVDERLMHIHPSSDLALLLLAQLSVHMKKLSVPSTRLAGGGGREGTSNSTPSLSPWRRLGPASPASFNAGRRQREGDGRPARRARAPRTTSTFAEHLPFPQLEDLGVDPLSTRNIGRSAQQSGEPRRSCRTF